MAKSIKWTDEMRITLVHAVRSVEEDFFLNPDYAKQCGKWQAVASSLPFQSPIRRIAKSKICSILRLQFRSLLQSHRNYGKKVGHSLISDQVHKLLDEYLLSRLHDEGPKGKPEPMGFAKNTKLVRRVIRAPTTEVPVHAGTPSDDQSVSLKISDSDQLSDEEISRNSKFMESENDERDSDLEERVAKVLSGLPSKAEHKSMNNKEPDAETREFKQSSSPAQVSEHLTDFENHDPTAIGSDQDEKVTFSEKILRQEMEQFGLWMDDEAIPMCMKVVHEYTSRNDPRKRKKLESNKWESVDSFEDFRLKSMQKRLELSICASFQHLRTEFVEMMKKSIQAVFKDG